jgi:uncharacterized protein YbbC (DUF1343 family)
MKKAFVYFLSLFVLFTNEKTIAQEKNIILPGAYQTEQYIPLLLNKRVGIFTNHTAIINEKHLIDTLLKAGVSIKKIFTPEHGLRGTADAGEKTNNGIDAETGIQIVSLYGSKYGPDENDLKDIDILLFDIQDVGARFYTYISSLHYFMEAAKDNNKPLLILDRPNPNGHYVDGPVLEPAFSSFVGKNPIPIVYGMTIGEYATMLNGEHWLKEKNNNTLSLTVIPCKNYNHTIKYTIKVAPSPNLTSMNAIYWYPITCLIEGTVLSEGRGTDHAFAYIGHPLIANKGFQFTPTPRVGAQDPKLKGQVCFGWDLSQKNPPAQKIDLEWILEVYNAFPLKDSFFLASKNKSNTTTYYFNKLAGTASLMYQLQTGVSAKDIRASWQKELIAFKKIRKKYLMYKDFE